MSKKRTLAIIGLTITIIFWDFIFYLFTHGLQVNLFISVNLAVLGAFSIVGWAMLLAGTIVYWGEWE